MRAQVVLLQGDRILMARHRASNRTYWVLPGGEVDEGETPEEAAVREVREETGLGINILRRLFVDGPRSSHGITVKSPRHTFLAEIVSGQLRDIKEPEGGTVEKGHFDGAAWMPFDSLEFDEGTRYTLQLVNRSLDSSRYR